MGVDDDEELGLIVVLMEELVLVLILEDKQTKIKLVIHCKQRQIIQQK